MLSAFQAETLVEFKPRDKSKIESILAYGMEAYYYGSVLNFLADYSV